MIKCPKIIGVVGLTGAGKSIVTRILTANYGFQLVRPGKHIREKLLALGLPETPESERKVQVAIREEYGMGALLLLSKTEIRESFLSGKSVLVDSMCSFSERQYLEEIACA